MRTRSGLTMLPMLTALLVSACSDDDKESKGEPDAGVDASASDSATSADAAGTADGGDSAVLIFEPGPPESARLQDGRSFSFDPATAPFAALANSTVETDRFSGVLDNAGYRIEVPKNWNGKLVMYAHGYVGALQPLRITTPSIRRHLVENGYAWAASSYSRNWYDVRAGVEDTNKLALNFVKIASQNGRTLAEPGRRYIVGHSMGGHVAGAAIEKETADTALNKVSYDGAVPMCGVMGDSELFQYLAAYQIVAQHIAGMPATAWPAANYAATAMPLQMALFSTFPTGLTALGEKLRGAVMNLTGGKRPVYELGFAAATWQGAVWMTFGGDGTIAGILEKNVNDTREIVYQLDADPAQNAEETALNSAIFRVTPSPDANALRPSGLRWIPKINGEFSVKVVTLHTLGDLYVPFKMQQLYKQRADAKGNGDKLVQRIVRGVGHCEFTSSEQTAAFDAMINWAEQGVKPEGDEVLNPSVVADLGYGCKFTRNEYSAEEMAAGLVPASRATVPACPAQ